MTLSAKLPGTPLQHALGIIVVYLVCSCGGILFAILAGGIDLKIGKVGPIRIKPLLTKITIPPLVGMIIFGFLARNFLCNWYMDFFPDKYASEIRSISLSIVLLRGGMTIDFTGKGIKVVLLCIIPQLVVAASVALATRWLFNIPWALSFASGFTIAAVSNSVVVPSCMGLHNGNFGVKKGINLTLIAAGSFENIIAITIFSIFFTIGFNEAPGGENSGEQASVGVEVGYVIAQIVGALVAAFIIGWSMKIFNRWSPAKTIWFKFAVSASFAIGIPILCEELEYTSAKYVFIVIYGYMCFRMWGKDKPEAQLAFLWNYIAQPMLFGTLGASILLSKLNSSLVGLAIACLAIGFVFRWLATFTVTWDRVLNYKERAFMAFAWMPKSGVPAALGGLTLAKAKERGLPEYEVYGAAMLTTAVLAVVIMAPIGAILINTLGPKWLSNDGETLEKDG